LKAPILSFKRSLKSNIFESLAQFERELIRERTLAGLETAKKQGRKGVRPRSLSEEQRDHEGPT